MVLQSRLRKQDNVCNGIIPELHKDSLLSGIVTTVSVVALVVLAMRNGAMVWRTMEIQW